MAKEVLYPHKPHLVQASGRATQAEMKAKVKQWMETLLRDDVEILDMGGANYIGGEFQQYPTIAFLYRHKEKR